MQPEFQARNANGHPPTPAAPPPRLITGIEQLEERLSDPPEPLVAALAQCPGDFIVLGAGGKMGPSLARMVRRAADAAGPPRRVIAVSRFSDEALAAQLRAWHLEVISADLLTEGTIDALPDAPNILYLVSRKFGTAGTQSLTWALNTYVPALVLQRFRRSRIVVMSTGNVYGLVPLPGKGSSETDLLRPTGEYAMSALARERVVEYFSRAHAIPVSIVRLNYACELRYGVLVDLARQVWAEEPVDVRMPAFNVIWQRDANAAIIRAFVHAASPPAIFNLTGPETVSVREAAAAFGREFGKPVRFEGQEASDALLSNSEKARHLLGAPEFGVRDLIAWIAHWLKQGGPTFDKPTRFQVRDGQF